jgi:uncharacterized repeat protein (TIGR02543 family)
MKTKKVKILIMFMAVMTMFSFLSGCNTNKEKETEYFRYRIYDDKATGKYVQITGLTEKGANQEVLIVPKEIAGVRVENLKAPSKLWGETGLWKSDSLRKVFLHENYRVNNHIFRDCSKLEVVCIINYSLSDIPSAGKIVGDLGGQCFCYINPNVYFSLDSTHMTRDLKPANVVFYFNYEGSENYGIYWIDNMEYGEKIDIVPESPVRVGYEFEGWFKNSLCTEKWDFENDTLPEVQTENGEIMYQETRLYAKWNSL